jgi:hypothetical protein
MGIGRRTKDARAGGSNGATSPLCTHYTRVYLERRWCIDSAGGRRASATPYLGCSVTKVTVVARSGSPRPCWVRPERVVRRYHNRAVIGQIDRAQRAGQILDRRVHWLGLDCAVLGSSAGPAAPGAEHPFAVAYQSFSITKLL